MSRRPTTCARATHRVPVPPTVGSCATVGPMTTGVLIPHPSRPPTSAANAPLRCSLRRCVRFRTSLPSVMSACRVTLRSTTSTLGPPQPPRISPSWSRRLRTDRRADHAPRTNLPRSSGLIRVRGIHDHRWRSATTWAESLRHDVARPRGVHRWRREVRGRRAVGAFPTSSTLERCSCGFLGASFDTRPRPPRLGPDEHSRTNTAGGRRRHGGGSGVDGARAAAR